MVCKARGRDFDNEKSLKMWVGLRPFRRSDDENFHRESLCEVYRHRYVHASYLAPFYAAPNSGFKRPCQIGTLHRNVPLNRSKCGDQNWNFFVDFWVKRRVHFHRFRSKCHHTNPPEFVVCNDIFNVSVKMWTPSMTLDCHRLTRWRVCQWNFCQIQLDNVHFGGTYWPTKTCPRQMSC
jgi:hypothetical protein